MAYQDDLIDNYREIAESRDWTLEQMADHVEDGDPKLAAELRKHAAESGGKAKTADDAKPRGRRAPGAKSEG